MLRFRFPRDDSRFRWTNHIKNKMLFYGLAEGRVRRVVQSPKRREKGIAPGTIAVMQRNDRGKKKEEIWVMYCSLREPRTHADWTRTVAELTRTNTDNRADTRGNEKRLRTSASSPRQSAILMVSAWRYPGISKPGRAIPIPEDILAELTEFDKVKKMD